MEVLTLLRDFAMKDKRILVEDGMAKFDGVEYSMKTELPLKTQQAGKYYKLEDIWYLLQQKNKPWLQYMKECQKHEFAFVAFLDFKPILNYLTGVAETTKCFDPDFKPTATLAATAPTNDVPAIAAFVGESVSAVAEDSFAPAPVSLGQEQQGPVEDSSFTFAENEDGDFVIDDAEAVKSAEKNKERPLTVDEQRKRAKKEETLRRDEEEELNIGRERSMKLKEILADAEVVREIRAKERVLITRDSLMKSNTRNFKQYLNLMYLRQTEARNLHRPSANKRSRVETKADSKKKVEPKSSSTKGSSSSRHHGGSSSRPSSSSNKKGKHSSETVPIIIVPAGASTQIGLVNAKDFFELGQWVSLAKKKEELKANAPVGKTTFIRHTEDEDGTKHSCIYEVYDNPSGFSSSDWKRVVAVFAFGKDWQFKDWKLGDAATMFQRVCGFYLGFRGEAVPPAIANWNITSLSVDKNSRHLDAIAYRLFWERLDKHVGEKIGNRLKTR